MLRIVVVPFALVLLLAGAIITPTPLPFGIPMMAVAIFLLIGSSKLALRLVRRLRRHWGWLDNLLSMFEERTAGSVARTFRRSRPRRKPAIPRS